MEWYLGMSLPKACLSQLSSTRLGFATWHRRQPGSMTKESALQDVADWRSLYDVLHMQYVCAGSEAEN